MTENDQVVDGGGPRSPAERKANALRLLAEEIDVWVATADSGGVPCLVPLTFWWDGEAVWLATRPTNPTGANMAANGLARLCLGRTRDVVLIEGTVRAYAAEALPAGVGDAFAAKDGWDPRQDTARYDFYRVAPDVLRAWGTVAELPDRTLLRDGAWLL
ncbi:pyridoxamine 5'-phosphate oxidase family protein [Actinacidiphila alni]|uniref:pyridoxamine 5'-phosphate oxidase family protein n=1 Tax=Actinacidiphila alni TaxID=380248 RepID=UPI0033BFEC0B